MGTNRMNGQQIIKIRNKQTGEIKEVPASQFQSAPSLTPRQPIGTMPDTAEPNKGLRRKGAEFFYPQNVKLIDQMRSGELPAMSTQQKLLGGIFPPSVMAASGQLGAAGREAGFSTIIDLATAGLLNKLIKPAFAPVSRAVTQKIPSGIANLSLRESPKFMRKLLGEKFTQEVVEKATGEVAERPAKEIGEGIVEKGIIGKASGLAKKSIKELSEKIPDSLESKIRLMARNLPGEPNIDEIFNEALERAGGTLPKASDLKSLVNLSDDIISLQRKKLV